MSLALHLGLEPLASGRHGNASVRGQLKEDTGAAIVKGAPDRGVFGGQRRRLSDGTVGLLAAPGA